MYWQFFKISLLSLQRKRNKNEQQKSKQNSYCIIGKPADDDVKLGALKLKPNTKIMMMGTREESLVNILLAY